MWKGIKLLSFWHCDQAHAARFQSSAAFSTGKTIASRCGMAVEVHCISAEPGCTVKSRGAGTARTAAQPKQHSRGAQPLDSYAEQHICPKPSPYPRKT